ncbi:MULTISPECIES: hypothetical protein [Fusobacterium]|uniref:Uncharacterized protein n=1 Tax=Fusobacterium nucleatum TaxID=851 RepID=A0A323U012_FUSNU|nr:MULTISPECIES: hypothetical protein [Fusobacterium]PCR86177.1 hypothetical protein CQA79_00220 [Fusobacterium nucleatum]PZA05509.1 hypothetical protein DNF10_01305 [Fusobacterium nucleatum]QJX50243.1 hypothetical protein HOO60_04940 [Fusobacterium nucleatum]HCE33111.1 hypothetical protein [Fusobacterium sp.]
MEDQEKNKEYQNEKNYIVDLEELGFLKLKKNDLSFEEERYKKKYKILQYDSKEVREFISKLRNIKVNEERIVEKELKSKKNEKFPNKFLFKDVSMGRDIHEILLYFLSKEEKEDYYDSISSIKNKKNEYIGFNRKIIKTWKCRYKGTEYINEKCSYIEKINLILASINISKKNIFYPVSENIIDNLNSIEIDNLNVIEEILDGGSEVMKYNIANASGEEFFTYCYHDALVQLLVYDFLHYNFSNEEKEENFNKIENFLKEYFNYLEQLSKKIDSINREGEIYNDFKDFLILNANLFKEKQKLKDIDLFQEYSLKTKPLSKEKDFLFFLSKQFETLKNPQSLIFCGDFLDLDIVKGKVDKENGFSNLNNFQNLEVFKKSDISEILYGSRKPKNNFNEEQEALKNILSNYIFFSNANLQMQKAIISIVTQEKSLIYPFRKQLKSLITDEELRNNNRVISILRTLLTREMYKEKNNEEGFKKSNILQKKIIEILLKINSIKDSSKRIKIKKKFFEDFFKTLIKIQKKKIIISPLPSKLLLLNI